MRKLKGLTQDCVSVAESEQREGQDGEREIGARLHQMCGFYSRFFVCGFYSRFVCLFVFKEFVFTFSF